MLRLKKLLSILLLLPLFNFLYASDYGFVSKQVPLNTISINEKGILIEATYPTSISKNDDITIEVSMTNNFTRVDRGGVTLSFPQLSMQSAEVTRTTFETTTHYPSYSRIYNQLEKRKVLSNYYMIEGWEDRVWNYSTTKRMILTLKLPSSFNDNQLIINLRGVLSIVNGMKKEITVPSKGSELDQQNYFVEQFYINIKKDF